MHECGLVVPGEAAVLLVEELDSSELGAVKGGQRHGEPALKGLICGLDAE